MMQQMGAQRVVSNIPIAWVVLLAGLILVAGGAACAAPVAQEPTPAITSAIASPTVTLISAYANPSLNPYPLANYYPNCNKHPYTCPIANPNPYADSHDHADVRHPARGGAGAG